MADFDIGAATQFLEGFLGERDKRKEMQQQQRLKELMFQGIQSGAIQPKFKMGSGGQMSITGSPVTREAPKTIEGANNIWQWDQGQGQWGKTGIKPQPSTSQMKFQRETQQQQQQQRVAKDRVKLWLRGRAVRVKKGDTVTTIEPPDTREEAYWKIRSEFAMNPDDPEIKREILNLPRTYGTFMGIGRPGTQFGAYRGVPAPRGQEWMRVLPGVGKRSSFYPRMPKDYEQKGREERFNELIDQGYTEQQAHNKMAEEYIGQYK